MKTLSQPLKAYQRGRTLESSRWYMGSLMTLFAGEEEAHGDFSLVEYLAKPGNEPPPHVHQNEDEFFYILEGEIDAYVGREVFNAKAGECVSFPRLTPHAFLIRSPRLRALIFTSPGGFERYFLSMSSPAEALEMPTGALTYSQSDMEEAIRMAAAFGLTFLTFAEIAEQLPAFPGMPVPELDKSKA
jgi:mannose-6-phosphate isomerase-like protein (cupin superfamily)